MLSKEQIKQVLVSQRQALLRKQLGVEREVLKEIELKKKLPHVVVITGIRRSGKSTILRQIIHNVYDNKEFYYINFEDERLYGFKAENFNDIYESLVELYGECKTFFIDEIQNIGKFETFVRRFYDEGFKFYITGSNASLLSKELGTKLTGRHVDIIVRPFSFTEFLKLKEVKLEKSMVYATETRVKLRKLFDEYLTKGGMPEYLVYGDIEILTRTYEDILIKDIIARYKVENVGQLRELYHYLANNFSNKFSYNSIKKLVGLGSVNTIKKYVACLEETYFAKIINKFDFSLKKQLVNDKKLYVRDNGFIQVISTKLTKDRGWLLENLVFNMLESQFTELYYFYDNVECDFVILQNKSVKGVVQVAWELNEDNKSREINGLLSAMKKLKQKSGILLTYDQEEDIKLDDKKIMVKPVWKWLLERNSSL